jgi:hypothetical protein
VRLDDEEDAIGEPGGQHAADFRLSPKEQMRAGQKIGAVDGILDRIEKPAAEALRLPLVPERGGGDIRFRRAADDDLSAHALS